MTSILVLNFNRPAETKLCLESIKRNALFEHETILVNNGGDDHEQIFQYFQDGLIDKLLLCKNGTGGGRGTIDAFNLSLSPYSVWIENDCFLNSPVDQKNINELISTLENPSYNVKCVDLTGGICGNNIYSGRSFFINTEFYKSIKKDSNGEYLGPGHEGDGRFLEYFIQQHFKENNYNIIHIQGILGNNGKWSVRGTGDGLYKHSTDEKKLYVLKTPTYKTPTYPPLDDEEWELMLQNKWIGGTVPKEWIPHQFLYWKE